MQNFDTRDVEFERESSLKNESSVINYSHIIQNMTVSFVEMFHRMSKLLFSKNKKGNFSNFRDNLIDYGKIELRKISLQCLQIFLVLTNLFIYPPCSCRTCLKRYSSHAGAAVSQTLWLCRQKGKQMVVRYSTDDPVCRCGHVMVLGHWHVLKTKIDLKNFE